MGEGIAHPHRVFIIEAKNLVISITQRCHLHSAALAHAHAVSIAPGLQHPVCALLLYAPQLVSRAVDAKPQRVFQFGEDAACQRKLPTAGGCLANHIEVHHGI